MQSRLAATLTILSMVVAVASSGRAAPTEEVAAKPDAQVQRDVRAIVTALYAGDVETVARFTHPAVVQAIGGRDVMMAALRSASQGFKQLQMKIESLTFPRPPEFFDGGGRRFVFVPTLMILMSNGQRAESLNFQMGVLDAGSTQWTYVEGSRLTPENVQILFPGFPKERAFPPFYRKRIDTPADPPK